MTKDVEFQERDIVPMVFCFFGPIRNFSDFSRALFVFVKKTTHQLFLAVRSFFISIPIIKFLWYISSPNHRGA